MDPKLEDIFACNTVSSEAESWLVAGEKTGAKTLSVAAWSGLVGPSYIIGMSKISNDSVVSTCCDGGEDISRVEGSGVEVRKDADGWLFSYMST